MPQPVRVPTVEDMAAMIPAWDDAATPLGPFTDAVLETEAVRPCNIQIVSGYLASLLVQCRGVTAKNAYLEIQGGIQARGEMEICRDVLVWLRAACTA